MLFYLVFKNSACQLWKLHSVIRTNLSVRRTNTQTD